MDRHGTKMVTLGDTLRSQDLNSDDSDVDSDY